MRRCHWAVWLIASWAFLGVDDPLGAAGTPQDAARQIKADGTAGTPEETGSTFAVGALGSARQAMCTLIVAIESGDYRTAVTALDFSSIEPPPDDFAKVAYARRLKAVVDRLALVEPEAISDDSDGPPALFPPGDNDASITIARSADGQWRVSPGTVAKIDALYEVWKNKPIVGTTFAGQPIEANGELDDRQSDPVEDDAGPVDESEDKNGQVRGDVPEGLRSARRTMRTLMEGYEDRDYATVVSTLEFSEEEAETGPYARLRLARQLKAVIERLAVIDYAQISDDPSGPKFLFPPEGLTQPIEIARDAIGIWRFTPETVARIDGLFEIYKDRPVLNLIEEERPWYDRELFLGNATWRFLALAAAIFLSLLAGQFARQMLTWWGRRLEKRNRHVLGVVATTLSGTARPVFVLVGLNIGMQMLVLDHEIASVASTLIRIVFSVVIGYVLFRLVDVVVALLRQLTERSGSTLNDMLTPIVSTSLRLTVIVLILLEIVTAISQQPPSTVIAGLGAGGLAVGLAAQDTIKNFFGSVMIFADRPFELGDRIVVDGHDGPVESVGFRSTKVRTLDGHLVTIPNGELAHKTIRNIGKRPYIRRVMNISVTSDTGPNEMRRALEILRELLDDHEGADEQLPPRVFLHDFLANAVNLRAIYWYHPPDYWRYCEFGERLNMEIVGRFAAEGIRFAVPSQRLFLTDERPPSLPDAPT